MPVILERAGVYGTARPELVFYGISGGFLADPVELSFQVFDASTDDKYVDPVQVFPTTPGNRQTVNLVTDRLGIGRYAATWTVPATEPKGRHEIKWFWRWTLGDPERTAVEEFEVLEKVGTLRGPYYSSVTDLVTDGVTGSNAALLRLLGRASRFVERVTGRRFAAVYRSAIPHDDLGRGSLYLDEPIIAVENVLLDGSETQADGYRVYNRHTLAQGAGWVDDRDNPRIGWIGSGWPATVLWDSSREHPLREAARLALEVTGVFGYTDTVLAPWGRTPEEIEQVTRLLAARMQASATGGSGSSGVAGPIIEERTRDQSVRYSDARAKSFGESGITGDPEIDSILGLFTRPGFVGSP